MASDGVLMGKTDETSPWCDGETGETIRAKANR
jgi:hypothetical protein